MKKEHEGEVFQRFIVLDNKKKSLERRARDNFKFYDASSSFI